MKFLKPILLIVVPTILLSVFNAGASHIVGGDFTYKRLSGNNFEITLKLFRDCASQAPFDNQINIGIFEQGTNAVIDSTVTDVDSVYFVPLTMPGTICAPPPNVCAEAGVYVDTISLAPNPNGYYIAWQRCCRNGGIVNMDNGNNTGIAFVMEIPDPAIINSSPVFDFEPLPYVCEEQPFNLDYSATDPDGDVLVYSAAEPLAGTLGWPVTPSPAAVLTFQVPGPYPVCIWNPGFSAANMFGSNVPLVVDANTGFMSAKIDLSGLYAVAVEVREFRNGVQIGMIRREIEISSIICLNNAPNLSPSSTPVVYNIYETDTLCKTFIWEDADSNNVVLTVEGNVLGGPGTTPPYATATDDSSKNIVTSDFCWETTCGQGREEPYYVVYTAVDDGCPLPFTTIDSIAIQVNPMPVFGPSNILCANLLDPNTLKLVWIDSSIISKYFERFEVYRSKNGSAYTMIGTINSDTARSFTDVNAIGNSVNDYCYYIKSVNKCGVEGPASDTLCSVSQINSKTNYLQYVTVLDDQAVELKWDSFPDAPYSTFYIYEKINDNSSSFGLSKTLVYPTYDSLQLNGVGVSANSYCYYLVNADWCGNISPPSNTACTIHLEGDSKPLVNYLTWTPYVNWKGGVTDYEIEVSKAKSFVNVFEPLNVTSSMVRTYYDELPDPAYGIFTYRITAHEGSGSADAISRSNEVTLEQVPFIFTPNAFTPNGDGINDYWSVSTNYVAEGSVVIFNRWGQRVYNGSINSFWDGTFNGRTAPVGVYVYRIDYEGFGDATKETVKGLLHVIR